MLSQPAIQLNGNDYWGSPSPMTRSLHREFHFTVDAAACHAMDVWVKDREGNPKRIHVPQNNKVARWFGPGGEAPDGLAASWAHEAVYVNPPFSNIQDWTRKAYYESRQHGALVVMLLKAATERRDFHQYVWPAASEVRFVAGRLKYEQPGKSESATFPSCIVIWRPGIHDEGPALTACDDLGRLTRLAA